MFQECVTMVLRLLGIITPPTSFGSLCQLVPHVNPVFLLWSCLCCAVISAEPCIITGHLGAVGRDEPAASDDQTYC